MIRPRVGFPLTALCLNLRRRAEALSQGVNARRTNTLRRKQRVEKRLLCCRASLPVQPGARLDRLGDSASKRRNVSPPTSLNAAKENDDVEENPVRLRCRISVP